MSTIRETLAAVHRDGLGTREIAEAAFAAATEADNREMALRGWQDETRNVEADSWRAEPRSGHQNGSGRYSESVSRPDQRVLGHFVRTNDGTAHRLGELTAAVCEQLRSEYGERKVRNAAGEKFFKLLADALAENGTETVADLGKERVEALRKKAGYRE